ncbi:helix-turn-helix transcriptional regulator [Desulfobacterales bacterium HSG16]|nr:helix-turn-helix transcriptional regulator [Desulfobacterales bacterium HSG16]
MGDKKKSGSDEERVTPEDLRASKDEEIPEEILDLLPSSKRTLFKMVFGITSTAVKFASKTTGVSAKVGKAIFASPERKKMVEEAGASIRDLREVTGLTVNDLSDALQLPDQSLLKAVENGTATLSFELILRLSSLLARHDPLPFVIRFTRTYNPEVWSVLQDWGLGRLPLQLERERKFINIYRGNDKARTLSDEAFERVLAFVNSAFEMSLNFALETDCRKGEQKPESKKDEKFEDSEKSD